MSDWNLKSNSVTCQNEPVVTIGLCVKDAEETIREAVDSVINQTFPHNSMEIIFVDDGSKDNTLEIISDYASKINIRTKVFHTEWRGLGPARQTVVDNASGEFILWVDDDSQLSKDYVNQQVNFMKQHPSVGIAAGVFGVLPDDNWTATLENVSYVIARLRESGKPTSKLISTAGSIFRVIAIRNVGGFDCSITGAQEDTDLAYRIREDGWQFYITNAEFYHKQRKTWKALWKQHYWYGYGLHLMSHKNKGRSLVRDRPGDILPFSFYAYKLTHRKVVFLLPVNFVFKKTALLLGFLKAHRDGYGHD